MKAVLVLVLLAASAYALPTEKKASVMGQTDVDKMVLEAIERVRTLLKENDPYNFPQLPSFDVKENGYEFHVDLTRGLASKMSDFVVDELHTDLKKQRTQFQLTFPEYHYEIELKAKGKEFDGKGSFTIEMSHFVVSGYLEYSLENNGFQVKDLHLKYSYDGISTSQSFNSEGMPEHFERYFKTHFIDDFQIRKEEFASRVANHMKESVNGFTKGKTQQELIDWLKNFVKTAAPEKKE